MLRTTSERPSAVKAVDIPPETVSEQNSTIALRKYKIAHVARREFAYTITVIEHKLLGGKSGTGTCVY